MTYKHNNRRLFSLLAVLVLLTLLLIDGQERETQAASEEEDLPPVAAVDAFAGHSFDLPADIAHAGDDRLFVVGQRGVISVLDGRGSMATRKVFLDIRDRVAYGGEMGLLGLAFHPQYTENGYFFVNYTIMANEKPHTLIARFQVSADPDLADPNSELILLQIEQPYTNHNGGALKFGPDGLLYIALGDGGDAGDPDNLAQDESSLLGKMLRIDVDNPAPGQNYGIPANNPFIGQPARDEIWALGLRNPWRFSFDRQTGDLYIGDVGQNSWEEINFQPAESAGGENYGWRLKEGTSCFNPAQNCDPGGLTDPVYEYSHDVGCSVTGGYVYRGSEIPALQGSYVYADFCSGAVSALRRDGQGIWQVRPLTDAGEFVSTFGEDNNGEIYLALRQEGRIMRLMEQRAKIFLPISQR